MTFSIFWRFLDILSARSLHTTLNTLIKSLARTKYLGPSQQRTRPSFNSQTGLLPFNLTLTQGVNAINRLSQRVWNLTYLQAAMKKLTSDTKSNSDTFNHQMFRVPTPSLWIKSASSSRLPLYQDPSRHMPTAPKPLVQAAPHPASSPRRSESCR